MQILEKYIKRKKKWKKAWPSRRGEWQAFWQLEQRRSKRACAPNKPAISVTSHPPFFLPFSLKAGKANRERKKFSELSSAVELKISIHYCLVMDKKERAKERREQRRQEISLARTIPYSDHQRFVRIKTLQFKIVLIFLYLFIFYHLAQKSCIEPFVNLKGRASLFCDENWILNLCGIFII